MGIDYSRLLHCKKLFTYNHANTSQKHVPEEGREQKKDEKTPSFPYGILSIPIDAFHLQVKTGSMNRNDKEDIHPQNRKIHLHALTP